MYPSPSPRHRIPAPDKYKCLQKHHVCFFKIVPSLPPSLFILFVASSAAYSTSLKLSPAHSLSFEGLGIEGRRWDRGWISKPGRVAALPDSSVKQEDMTSIKRGSSLQRRALSGILQCLVKYMSTVRAHTLFPVGVREVHNRAHRL